MIRLPKSPAFQKLSQYFPKHFSLSKGLPVRLQTWKESGLEIRPGTDGVTVFGATPADHFRALGQLMASPKPLAERLQPAMDFRGLMIDCSRNGVLRPDYFERLSADLALMGFNKICLYTEDTFEVKGHPLIGYRRGRLSQVELRAMDASATAFGLEMFPCIQALGHLAQILKFKAYGKVRDTESVLNVNAEETYRFLEELLKNASAPFKSRMINVGMDETWDLGRGATFTPGKAVFPREMYLKHVKRVAQLCDKLGLKPMMWGDILMHGNSGGPAHLKSKQPAKAPVPANMDVLYWDYWSEDKKGYAANIDKCRGFGFDPMIAPGVLTEDRHWSFQPKMEAACGAFMETAKAKGVRRALLTRWGDNGCEAPLRSAYPAFAFFAQHAWRQKPQVSETRRLSDAVSQAPWNDFVEPVGMECLTDEALHHGANPAKAMFWDDPLLRIYGVHMGNQRVAGRISRAVNGPVAQAARQASKENKLTFQYIKAFGDALVIKADLGNEACAAYRSGSRAALKKISARVPAARRAVEAAWKAHRAVWLEEKKALGLEVLDLRYGGLINRLGVMDERLKDYLAGRIEKIEEFDDPDQKYLGKFPDIYWLWLTYNLVSTVTIVR
jgi:hypothetical protein